MIKSKKLISILLSLALLASSMFVGGIVASAANLFETTNSYDDVNVYYNTILPEEGASGQPKTLRKIGEDSAWPDEPYSAIAAWSATVDPCTVDSTAGYAVHFQAAKEFTNRWPAAALIYNSNDTESYGYYKASANTTYEIRLKYYVASTPDKQVNLRVSQRDIPSVNQSYGSEVDDMTMEEYAETYVLNSEVVAITEATNGWQEAVATFTTGSNTDSKAMYLNLNAASATDLSASNVDIWVDDITIAECTNITVHNYDGENDKQVPVSNYTTVAELDIPQREGYIFRGVYSDEAFETKLDTSANAAQYPNVYYKWARLNDGEYYAGFESYTAQTNVVSYDSAVAAIVSGDTYAGSYAMKAELAAGGITAFELRDKTAFDVKAQTEYTVSFAYKTSADAELSVGAGNSSNIPATAYAIEGGELTASDSWQTGSVTLTLDKGTADGYSIAMLVYSDTAATVYIDDVYVTYPYDDTTVNMPSIEGFTADWYPALKAFNPENEVEPIEAIEIWGGKDDVYAPQKNADGVYEITNGAELAYIIENGGTVGENAACSFILTNDIYLNDITKFDWKTGEVDTDYTIRSWYGTGGLTAFSGSIDGNGHTVFGLYNYDNKETYNSYRYGCALIPVVKGGTVSVTNLSMDYIYIRYECGASAFVGSIQDKANVSIMNCYAGKNITLNGCDVGVFRAYSWTDSVTTITNCYSYATLIPNEDTDGSASGATYGLAGYTYGTLNISNSFNANGPLLSVGASTLKVSNCYQSADGKNPDGVITISDSANMQGTDVFQKAEKMPLLNTLNAYVATAGYPELAIFKGVVLPEIWGGVNDVSAPKANADGVYEISKPSELAYIISTGGETAATYKLTSDIYLNNTDLISWSTGETVVDGYTPNSWYNDDAPFKGTIDGDGHVVYGLYYNEGATSANSAFGYEGRGLIPRVNDQTSVTVSKLGVDKAFVNGVNGVSAFVGFAGVTSNTTAESNAVVTIDQCYVGADVTIQGSAAGAFRGATNYSDTIITNSYSLATTTALGSGSSYGLVGGMWNSTLTVKNSYNGNDDDDKTGVIVLGWNNSIVRENNYGTGWNEDKTASGEGLVCYYATRLTASNMQGLDVFENTAKMPNLNTNGVFTATTGYPVLSVFVKETNTDTATDTGAGTDTDTSTESGTTTAPPIWDGSSTAPVSTAKGESADDPIPITNGAELHYVIRTLGGGGKYYKLTSDIYLNDITKINWQTGGVNVNYSVNSWFGYWKTPEFSGHIDGDNHTIYGLYLYQAKNSPSQYSASAAGLIPQVAAGAQASVTNLGIENAFVEYETCVGAIFGAALAGSTVTIDGCYVGSEVTLCGCESAAFIGEVRGATVNLTNSYSLATLINNGTSYGLITQNWFSDQADPATATITVKNCYNGNGPIISYVRSATVTLENCFETVKSADSVTSGVTLLTADNMKGADALTNSGKLKALNAENALFVPTAREFVDYDYYTYLPAGTILDSSLEIKFFDNRLAPLDGEDILYCGKMTRGAYVKFLTEPDVSLVTIPASVFDKVHQGTATAILESRDYYDIETEIVVEQLAEQPDNAVNYIFITDIHYGYGENTGLEKAALVEQMKLICKIADENKSIDFIVLGGDITQGDEAAKSNHLSDLNAILTPLVDCTKPVFVLVGNHDDNAYSEWDEDTVYGNKVISNLDWNNTVIDYVVNRTLKDGTVIDVSQGTDDTGAANTKYYYYDLEAKKTRIICLDASNFPHTYDENGTVTLTVRPGYEDAVESVNKYYNGYTYWGYSDAQIKWLANEAMTAEDGWDYIFFSHMGIESNVSGTSSYNNGDALSSIIAAYQNKTAYSNTDLGLELDYSDRDGRILSYQFGHEHNEAEVYSADMDLWQLLSSTANARQGTSEQKFGTENEAYFDVMSVSRETILRQNIGAGTTKRFANTVTYDAGDVNMDSATDICDLVRLQNIINGTASKATAADVNKNKLLEAKVDPTALRKLLIGAN